METKAERAERARDLERALAELAEKAAAVLAPEWADVVAAALPALAAARYDGAGFAAFALPPRDVRAVVVADVAQCMPSIRAAVQKLRPGAAESASLRNWSVQGVLVLDAVPALADAAIRRVREEAPAAPVMPCMTMQGADALVAALAAAGIDVRLRVPLLELYSDGARPGKNQRGAPGAAGCGWVMLAGPGAERCEGGGVPRGGAPAWRRPVPGAQTNQRAELAGLRGALRLAAATEWERAEIRTDSVYAMELATGRWRPKANHNLAAQTREAYLEASRRGPLSVIHIRGHGKAAAATPRQRWGNDLADAAASAAARGEHSA